MSLCTLACRVLQSLMGPHLQAEAIPASFMQYGFHRTPQVMTSALQNELDRIEEPSMILVGYGLCGNGLAGLEEDLV